MRPLQVYLDSNDFSVLSDPRKRTPEIVRIKEQLQTFADSGQVHFRFSAAHVCEAAPTGPEHTEKAAARADCIASLCQHHAFVSVDKLIARELGALYCQDNNGQSPYSDTGDWFPDISGLMSDIEQVSVADETSKALAERGLNRQVRRELKRKLFKHGSPRQETHDLLSSGKEEALNEIINKYPMKREHAKTLHAYIMGKATASEAEHAFLASLRDPSWMIRWFATEHARLSPVVQWMRGPAAKFTKALEALAAQARSIYQLEAEYGLEFGAARVLGKTNSARMKLSILRSLSERLRGMCDISPTAEICRPVSKKTLPSLGVAVEIAFDVMRDALQVQTPRSPEESDFGDIAHALYAPYVELFRADGYMAQKVENAVVGRGTKVVRKMSNLPEAISTLLKSKC